MLAPVEILHTNIPKLVLTSLGRLPRCHPAVFFVLGSKAGNTFFIVLEAKNRIKVGWLN